MIRHMVAIDSSRGIAKGRVQPWKLPSDEQYFTRMTKLYGGIVLMGRITYEVIGVLVERQNFVLTHDSDYQAGGVTVVQDLDAFFAAHPDVWVIGGGKVFEATLDLANELYITEIAADYDCDTFYPEYLDKFEIAQKGEQQIENTTTFRFMVYKPKNLTKML